MKPIITKVTITDFRSIENDFVELGDVGALVGANESGKTNILRAIKFIKPPITPDTPTDSYTISKEKDTRMLSTSFINQVFPRIEYELNDISRLIIDQNLKNYVVGNQIEGATLTRQGNALTDYSIELTIKTPPFIVENVSAQNVELAVEGKPNIAIAPTSWQIFEDHESYKQSIEEKVVASLLKFYDPSTSREFIKEKIKAEILANLKVFFWTYEEKEIIQDVVPIAEFITAPETYPRVYDLFVLGGWDKNMIATFLQNQSSAVYNNMLGQLSKDVTSIIKKSWRQNQKLNIVITHAGTALNILIRDNDYGTEYAQRSEGLKWFLSFLISFRAQTEKFKEYIILFDEPGLHLHPGGQKDILRQINILAESNQIVYSTHSIFTLDKRFPERVKLVSKVYDGKSYPLTKIKNSITENDILKDALLREVLGYSITDVSPISDVNLLVEGVFDRGFIQIGSKKYESEFGDGVNLNEVAIIACHAASKISKDAKHLEANSLKCLCLYDSDNAGKTSREANDAVTKPFKPLLGELVSGTVEMEDLCPKSVFEIKYKEYFLKEFPSDTKPLSKILEEAVTTKSTSETRDSVEVKHEFESLMLDAIEEYLQTHNLADDPELANIKTLIEKLSKLLKKLVDKK